MSVPTQGSELASRDHGGPKAIDSSKRVWAQSHTNLGLAEDGCGKKSRSGWLTGVNQYSSCLELRLSSSTKLAIVLHL